MTSKKALCLLVLDLVNETDCAVYARLCLHELFDLFRLTNRLCFYPVGFESIITQTGEKDRVVLSVLPFKSLRSGLGTL